MPSLEELRELEKNATPGPWGYVYSGSSTYNIGPAHDPQTDGGFTHYSSGINPPDVQLVVGMRNLFPLLLDFVVAWDNLSDLQVPSDDVIGAFKIRYALDAIEAARKAIEEMKL